MLLFWLLLALANGSVNFIDLVIYDLHNCT